ncbi:F-type H+-transporting ATPase subunit c [Clostridium punense]|uniref:ATP synthase subunit c n=1 Tax=Clostridium punense TaxID=1054297 RepID=A0ABS4JZW8_9CLOT|nr:MULTISPECIES: ATP synthase F0 subunit C [Clostridium]EQB89295.1 F0F1 ATP synthase subunit C [Clostridium sp. BL8]MBP2021073.1 F-type H+-transporting ATPase subunit c [Clostridium punense]
MESAAFIAGMSAIGAGIAALAVIGGGIGTGNATAKAVESIAKQPDASGKIMTALIIGGALSEATAIYGFLLGLLLILMGVKG